MLTMKNYLLALVGMLLWTTSLVEACGPSKPTGEALKIADWVFGQDHETGFNWLESSLAKNGAGELSSCPDPIPETSAMYPCAMVGRCTGPPGVCCNCRMVEKCGLTWKCADQRLNSPTCPPVAPAVGGPCSASQDGLTCGYCSAPSGPLNLLCGNGNWIAREFGCAN